jgi:hypothetical protein
MKNIIILIWFCGLPFIALAQQTTQETAIRSKYGLSIGYFGDRLSNAGYQLGIERYMASTRNFQVIGSVYFNQYFVPNQLTALALNARIGQRYTTNWGLSFETHLGIGAARRSFQYEAYSVNAQGDIVAQEKAAQLSVMPNLALGLGYDFSRKTKLPLLLFGRTSVNYLFPNKHFLFDASYALEAGVVYFLKKKSRQAGK